MSVCDMIGSGAGNVRSNVITSARVPAHSCLMWEPGGGIHSPLCTVRRQWAKYFLE